MPTQFAEAIVRRLRGLPEPDGIETLVGRTLVKIRVTEDAVYMTTDGDEAYKLHHVQDCCESVYLAETVGDITDLLNSLILEAEEVNDPGMPKLENSDDSFTWTFYKLGTRKGRVTFRFYGTSNGYYSESVDFVKIGKDDA